jgi:hypothetical protein
MMSASEHNAVGMLTEGTRAYRDAIGERCTCLIATERFYKELMVQQWRLDAVEILYRAATLTEPWCQAHKNTRAFWWDVLRGVSKRSFNRTSAHRFASQWVLDEIASQQTAAISSLEERAMHYSLLVCTDVEQVSSALTSERLAVTETQRNDALEHYRSLARSTFNEVESEARAICDASLSSSDVHQLCLALERRRCFWQNELEETWNAWQSSTDKMHRAGEDALLAWDKIKMALGFQRMGKAGQPIAKAIATFVARALEVELCYPLGFQPLAQMRMTLSLGKCELK